MRLKDLKSSPVNQITEAPVGIASRVLNWAGRKVGNRTFKYRTEIANEANELYNELNSKLKSTRKSFDNLTKIDLANFLSASGYKQTSTPAINKLIGNLQPTDIVGKKNAEEIILQTVEAAFVQNINRTGKFATDSGRNINISGAQKQALIAAGWTPPS